MTKRGYWLLFLFVIIAGLGLTGFLVATRPGARVSEELSERTRGQRDEEEEDERE